MLLISTNGGNIPPPNPRPVNNDNGFVPGNEGGGAEVTLSGFIKPTFGLPFRLGVDIPSLGGSINLGFGLARNSDKKRLVFNFEFTVLSQDVLTH